jgi:acyl carrier protein
MTTDLDSIRQALKSFILEQTNLDDPNVLQNDTDLFEAGLLDSLVAVSLVAFCEERYGCQMDASELSQDLFRSLNTIADFVAQRTAPKSPARPSA